MKDIQNTMHTIIAALYYKTMNECNEYIACFRAPMMHWLHFCLDYFTVFDNHRKSLIQHASEASYVYILSRQKLIKNAKNGSFWRVFGNLKLAVKQCYQTGQF